MIKSDAKLVYVAGPLEGGETAKNVHNAIKAGHFVMDIGHVPYVPHLDVIMTMQRPRKYEEWIAADFVIITRCDVLWRTPGVSPGADREVEFAESIGVPVVYTDDELEDLLNDVEKASSVL